MATASVKLLLHYYFTESDLHSMDAFVRNDNEKDLLLIAKELLTRLGVEVEIESEALHEGGIKQFFKFLDKRHSVLSLLTLIVSVITIVVSRIPVENAELVKAQRENLRLDNVLKEHELRKIADSVRTKVVPSQTDIDSVVALLETNQTLTFHRSNFYRRIVLYQKIDSLSTQRLSEDYRPLGEELIVRRADFEKFVLTTDELPVLTDESATISLISPVLRPGKFNWKGIYQGDTISFAMRDRDFRTAVVENKVKFENGSAINCVLQKHRKIDDNGFIRITRYDVVSVLNVISVDETPLNAAVERILRENRNKIQNQLNLGFMEEK